MKEIRCIIAALVIGALPFTAAAQDQDNLELRGRQVVIELDDEGRILVNGNRLSESDGPVVLRVRPDDGEVEVESIEPHRGVTVYDAHGRHVRGKTPGADVEWFAAFPSDFKMPEIPPIEPLIEGLRFGPGRDLKIAIDEHVEVAELERESRELARRARSAEGAERDELEADLRSTLNEIFDRKMELRRDRIDRLQEELDREQENLEERSAAREEMIERRFRHLVGEGDALEW